jgi:hypothetical protein
MLWVNIPYKAEPNVYRSRKPHKNGPYSNRYPMEKLLRVLIAALMKKKHFCLQVVFPEKILNVADRIWKQFKRV